MNNYHISFKRLGIMAGIFFYFLFLITSPNVFADLVTAYTFEPGTELKDVAVMLGGSGVAVDDLNCIGNCTSPDGVFGKGLEVGLADYFVTQGSSSDLNPGPNGFTIAFYTYGIDVQATGKGGSQLVSKYSPVNGWYCGTDIVPVEIRGGFVGGGTFNDLVVTDEGTVQGTWRHIALTFDGVNTSSLYIDGVQKLTRNDVNFVLSEIPVYFGVASHDPGALWHQYGGIFDDVAIFDEPLSAEAIERLSELGIEAYMVANPVIPLSYDMFNGESGTFRYWDKQYPDPDSTTALGVLSGGLGDLTDGIAATDNWNNVENLEGTGPYVGWRSINPTVTFNFAGSVTIDTVRIHVDNSNFGKVSLPSSVDIGMDGSMHSFAIPFDNTNLNPRWLEFSGLGLSGNSLNLTLFERSSTYFWIMLSEVAFYSDQPVNNPPVANAGPDQTLECAGATGTLITLDGSNSSDPDSTPGTNDDIISFAWSDDGTPIGTGATLNYTFSLGVHTVTLVVTDSFGETASDDVVITVEDTAPPEISVSVSPDTLWPPNHKMVLCTPTVTVSDNCDLSPTFWLESVSSNESEEAYTYAPAFDMYTSEGHTDGDIQIDNGDIYLRAERSGKGDGRIYTITYEATDASGNIASASDTVTVPHNQ